LRRRIPCDRDARLSALHCGVFCLRGRASRADCSGFPGVYPSSRAPCARSVVPRGGVPERPEREPVSGSPAGAAPLPTLRYPTLVILRCPAKPGLEGCILGHPSRLALLAPQDDVCVCGSSPGCRLAHPGYACSSFRAPRSGEPGIPPRYLWDTAVPHHAVLWLWIPSPQALPASRNDGGKGYAQLAKLSPVPVPAGVR
jgi:hypothetical protein